MIHVRNDFQGLAGFMISELKGIVTDGNQSKKSRETLDEVAQTDKMS